MSVSRKALIDALWKRSRSIIARVEGQSVYLLEDAALALKAPLTTDVTVEAAARAMFEEPGAVDPSSPDYMTWDEMAATDSTRADIWRADARRVLDAVEAVR